MSVFGGGNLKKSVKRNNFFDNNNNNNAMNININYYSTYKEMKLKIHEEINKFGQQDLQILEEYYFRNPEIYHELRVRKKSFNF